MNKFDFRKYIAENKFQTGLHKPKIITEGNSYSLLNSEIKRVGNKGGNQENLIQYGLPDVARHLDIYSTGKETIYTKKTLSLFKKFVESMADDEINNNQPNP